MIETTGILVVAAGLPDSIYPQSKIKVTSYEITRLFLFTAISVGNFSNRIKPILVQVCSLPSRGDAVDSKSHFKQNKFTQRLRRRTTNGEENGKKIY